MESVPEGWTDETIGESIAVVGMAGRYPESPNLDAFWDNLREARDCLHTFSDEELDAFGIPAEVYQRENFIRRGTRLPDREGFDSRFFGYTPKQAGIMDPQARIFLETSYEALEAAGYNPFDTGHSVGVFAGSNPNDYSLLLGIADPTDSLTAFDQLIGTDRDFVATRVSHNLGLSGPAMTLQTACSTSLVTVHAACQSLLSHECSMALAGGVSVNYRQGVGYFYQQGMILSPTGECRAFDADAQGTTLGQGCGVVVLKRLEDALDEGDNIVAVVRASAINNDGNDKLSYTAPSENGQAAVIATAHALADIKSDSIGYVETHGTGTLIGDPIEIAALTRAFRPGTTRTQYCAIGSAKTNFGHTDAAAGITGFIKAALALHHREIPASINFDTPNPDIDFANSPFFVNTELRPWESGPEPRRAGVSAFGIGGTNAHVVLEEAPSRSTPPADNARTPRILLTSAKTSGAADARVNDLADWLERHPALTLPAVDYTLRTGRPHLDHRRAVLVGDDRTLRSVVDGETDGTVVRGTKIARPGPLVWLFAGQGAQYPRMGADLYANEPAYAEAIDRVADHLEGPLGVDLRTLLLAEGDDAAERLRQTSMTQPALFAVEHAASCLLRSWGITPDVVIGHSIGEFAAAVEAGIMSWSDGATLVAERGRLMQSMEPGSMMSVGIAADELSERLPDGIELAAANSSSLSVASGPTEAVEQFVATLEAEGQSAQVLHTSHAFHSAMMDEAAERFADVVAGVQLNAPELPLITNVTGQAITPAEATDPSFWARQIRRPVLFSKCLATAAEKDTPVFLEIGPGRALSTFVSAHQDLDGQAVAVPSMRHPKQDRNDGIVLKEAAARLWTSGLDLDWDRINGEPTEQRVALPPYRFEREEAWLPEHRHVLALPHFGPPSAQGASGNTREPFDQWLYTPSWRLEPGGHAKPDGGVTVVLAPSGPAGDRLIEALSGNGDVIAIQPGDKPAEDGNRFVVHPGDGERLAELLRSFEENDVPVTRLVHAWTADPDAEVVDLDDLETALDLGVHSLLTCARGFSALSQRAPIRFDVVTTGAFSVSGGETVRPEASALLGPIKVVPLEYSDLTTRLIDLPNGLADDVDFTDVMEELVGAPIGLTPDAVVALRNGRRWTPTVAVHPTADDAGQPVLRQGGRYLIIGGLGGVGLSIARHLAETYAASMVLTSRRGRPTAKDDSDVETIKRLELLDEIEELASGLEVAAVDAADESAMVALVKRLEEQQPIDGIIVAAGVADQHGAIHRRSRDDMTASIAAKTHSTLVLERAIEQGMGDRRPDFVLLSSSIAATLYHNRFAQVGYVTGNAYAEAFALRGRQRGLRMTTVAWDDWLDIGMSVRAAQDFAEGFGTDVDLVDQLNSFAPADGVVLFERALRSKEAVFLVSPTDLEARIAADVDVVSPFLEQATAGDEVEIEQASTVMGTIAAAWTSLIGFESFEPTDHFFDLGGDSLQAARMADRLSRTFGCQIPVDRIFDSPVLSDLAVAIERLIESENESGPTSITDRENVVTELGPAQSRFLARGTERPEHFNISVLLEPQDRIEEDHLRSAVSDVLARHTALRLRLVEEAGEVAQTLVADTEDDPLEIVDLSTVDPSERNAALEASATEVQRGLDLHSGPVFRAVLYKLPNEEQRLLIVIHHLMSDRVSLLSMLDNLDASIKALQAGQELPSPQPETGFLDWVQAQSALAQGELEGQTEAWRAKPWNVLQPIPLDHPFNDDANRNTEAAAVEVEVPGAVAGTTGDVRVDELALLGLAHAIGAWADHQAVAIDVMGHGRRLPVGVDVSGAAGMFITYSPAVIDLRVQDQQQQLAELRSGLADGWTFDALRLYGTEDVRTELAAKPRAQVLFNYVGRSISADADALLVPNEEDPRGAETDQEGRRDHLLAVRADVLDSDALKLVFVYSTQLHDRSTIEKLAALTVDAIARLDVLSPGH